MRRNLRWYVLIVAVFFALWFFIAPPRFWLNLTKRVEVSPESGAQLVERYHCRQCHEIGESGSLKARSLNGMTRLISEADLARWLQNPRMVKPDTAMPNFKLSDTEISAILAYLKTLDS